MMTGTVLVPSGITLLTASLFLQSNLTLRVEEGATLLGTTALGDAPLIYTRRGCTMMVRCLFQSVFFFFFPSLSFFLSHFFFSPYEYLNQQRQQCQRCFTLPDVLYCCVITQRIFSLHADLPNDAGDVHPLRWPQWGHAGFLNGARCIKMKDPLVGWDDCEEWSKLENVVVEGGGMLDANAEHWYGKDLPKNGDMRPMMLDFLWVDGLTIKDMKIRRPVRLSNAGAWPLVSLYRGVPCCGVPWRGVVCRGVPWCAVPCCAVPCCVGYARTIDMQVDLNIHAESILFSFFFLSPFLLFYLSPFSCTSLDYTYTPHRAPYKRGFGRRIQRFPTMFELRATTF